jgi:protocatechuate 3,4-dioxygenase beta subunit
VGNGNGNPADASNINTTFLRGIQQTDSEGVTQVNTLFPGHYNVRTAHIHIMAHQNATVLPNNTLLGGIISHTGQLFFDQDLIDLVYTSAPYNTNTDPLTLNADDMPLNDTAASSDPVVEYAYVGEDVMDGLVSWITIGIDTTANETVNIAAWYTADGGVPNPDTYVPGG